MARPQYTKAQAVQALWGKVEKRGECWLWTGYSANHGYGEIRAFGKRWTTHRLAWTLTYGGIPEGLHVLHTCPGGDNKLCVNPAHLRCGTNYENSQDSVERGGRNRGTKNGMAKLTPSEVLGIRAANGSNREVAVRFNISPALVSMVRNRKRWGHV
jgi:hypothetical protein